MTERYGAMFGPDITFLGVPRCTLEDPSTYADADVVVIGAPFDGGTSHRPGTRFGPQAIRSTDYLGHDGSRPSLALRVDALRDLVVVDAGDVEMPPGHIERSLGALEEAVTKVARDAGRVGQRDRVVTSQDQRYGAGTRDGVHRLLQVAVRPLGLPRR